MHYLAGELTKHGIDLKEVRIVSDDAPAIEAAAQTLSQAYDHVFTSGGIGPTHDDITADCIAQAFGAHIDVRADARALLEEHYKKSGRELNTAPAAHGAYSGRGGIDRQPGLDRAGVQHQECACDGRGAVGFSGDGGQRAADSDRR